MWRDRSFSASAILTLALAVGANTAVFAVLYNLVLRPLPFPRPDQLIRLELLVTTDARGARPSSFSDDTFQALTAATEKVARLTSYASTSLAFKDDRGVERIAGEVVTSDYFAVLGVVPAIGRTFTPEIDGTVGERAVVVISNALWHSRFAARQDILGAQIHVDGLVATVIGVTPEGFRGMSRRADVWIPKGIQSRLPGGGPGFSDVIGRLADGATTNQAAVQVRAVVAGLPRPSNRTVTLDGIVLPLAETEREPQLRSLLRLLYVGVLLVVLIACANVANLLAVRGLTRRSEMITRLALGATRLALMRQLLTETMLLAVMGAGAGLLLATWSLTGLAALRPTADVNVWPIYTRTLDVDAFRIGPVIGLFASGLALFTTFLCGVWPAWRAGRDDIRGAFDRERTGPKMSGRIWWRALIVGQLALVFVLLNGAALTIRSLDRLMQRPAGIDPDGVLTFRLSLPTDRYGPATARPFFDSVRRRVAALPGVEEVARLRHVPIVERGTVTDVEVDGSTELHHIGFNAVDPNFLRVFRARLIAGRFFLDRDATGPPVAVVTEGAARALFGHPAIAIGHRLRVMQKDATIVGLVADIRYEPQRPQLPIIGDVYVDIDQQSATTGAYFAVRTNSDPRRAMPSIRSAIATLDPEIPVYDAVTMADRVKSVESYARFTTLVLSIAGAIALMLAIVGIVGTLAFAVSSRRQEIGIRMALGASRPGIIAIFLGDGLLMCALGFSAGIPLAAASAPAMRSALFEIAPDDPVSSTAAAVLLIVAAVVACAVPAWRAAAVDPARVLRD